MIALVYDTFGEPETVVEVQQRPVPEPEAGEVRLRVLRSPIHNHDLATIRGVYGNPPPLPAIGGTEVLGIVEKLGEHVASPPLETRVVALTLHAWAEYVTVRALDCVPVPDTLDDDAASQLLAMPVSAVVLLQTLGVSPGEWIVQNAANGAVGRIVMHLAQARGIHVINLVRSESAREQLQALGAKHVLSTSDVDWQTQARELAPEGIARAVDSVGGPETEQLLELLAPQGALIIFGGLSGSTARINSGRMIMRELIVRGFWMQAWMANTSASDRGEAIRAVFEGVAHGDITLSTSAVFPFDRATEAIRAAQTPGRNGKVLLGPA